MKFDLDRRVANAIKRLHAQVDEWCADANWQVSQEANQARFNVNVALTTAARSVGQFRRHRNAKGEST